MQTFRAFISSVLGRASDAPVLASLPGRRTVVAEGFTVELDLSSQVLAIHAFVDREIRWGQGVERGTAEAPLSATLGTIDSTQLVSASVLAQKAKIFDDGLYAAVEVAAQEGAGLHAGKAALLASLGGALAGLDPSEAGGAQALILGAARLGHVAVPGVPGTVQARVDRGIEAFLTNQERSKPIGFYTWSRQLESIFQQDRMLQSGIDKAGIKAVASALRTNPSTRATYDNHLRLVSRLTGPLANPDLRTFLDACDRGKVDVATEGIRFFPPSVAHETEIIKKLFGTTPIPGSFVLVDEMIRQIRSGEVDLEPRDASGWYDYQTWALEALVVPERMPEGERLELDNEYRKLLLELFKGLLTLTRETHIKQLEIPLCGAAGGRWKEEYIDIAPALSAEPLVTFYLRRALGYRYIRAVLEDTFGAGQLERLHRLTQAGSAPKCLAEELAGIEALFLGAHVTVSKELGHAPDPASGSDAAASEAADQFAAWVRALNSDPDLGMDSRAMVPVFYDAERRKLKVWVFLGWARRPITVSFARPPESTILGLRGRSPWAPSIRWGDLRADLPYPVTAELYVDQILDRDEFRRLCDVGGTRTEIMKRLEVSCTTPPLDGR